MSDDVADIGYLELQTDRDMRGSVSFLFASACVIILSITSTLLHYISFLSSIQRELQNVKCVLSVILKCASPSWIVLTYLVSV